MSNNNNFCKIVSVVNSNGKFQVLVVKEFYHEKVFQLDVHARINNRLIGSKIICKNEEDLQKQLLEYDVKKASQFITGIFASGAHNM